RQFGITIAGATVLSAFVAFTLDPMLSARFAKQRGTGEVERFDRLKRPFLRFYAQMDAVYLAVLQWIVGAKRRMAAVLVGSFALMFLAFHLASVMGSEFMSVEDRGVF